MPTSAAITANGGYFSLLGLEMDLTGAITLAIFMLLLILTFAWFAAGLVRGKNKANHRVRLLAGLVADLDEDDLPAQRQTALDHAERLRTDSDTVSDAWHEFDESLVLSSDRRRLHNTVDADYFFNTETLAGELLHSRMLTFLPSAMTALGVLGTFTGLVLGLAGLELGADANSDELRTGVSELIAGASLAFVTSVFGVFLSLFANVCYHQAARKVSAKVKKTQESIDQLFTRHTADHSLIEIERTNSDSNQALQELHEKIGAELQKAVTGLSQDMQAAVTAALEGSIAPAMESISQTASAQSREVFESLIGDFTASFESLGIQQASSITNASEQLNSSLGSTAADLKSSMESMTSNLQSVVGGMSSGVDDVMNKVAANSDAMIAETTQHSETMQRRFEELTLALGEQRRHTEEIINRLAETVDAAGSTMKTSSTHLQTTARELEKVSGSFTEASATITTHVQTSTELLEASATRLEEAASLQKENVDSLTAQHERFSTLQDTAQSVSASLERAAETAQQGFSALEDHQNSYLSSLSQEFNQLTEGFENRIVDLSARFDQLSEGFQTNVDGLQRQMKEWLDDYATAVSEHTKTRMDEWNTLSQDYAGNMVKVAQQLAETMEEIDDLKGRVKRAALTSSN